MRVGEWCRVRVTSTMLVNTDRGAEYHTVAIEEGTETPGTTTRARVEFIGQSRPRVGDVLLVYLKEDDHALN